MHNRIPQTNAAHNALCSAVCTRPGSRIDYTPLYQRPRTLLPASTTLVTATGNGSLTDRPVRKSQSGPFDTSFVPRIGSRLQFEGTVMPSIPTDKFRVLKDVSVVYAEDGRRAVENLHVIQARRKSPWRTLRSYDRVAYTARVRDWSVTPGGHLFASIERPTLIRPQYNR